MKTTTKSERVQPTCAGVNEKGELVWEGRQMPHWQMEMFKVAVDWYGPFFGRWLELAKQESTATDFDHDNAPEILQWLAASKKKLESFRRMYPAKTKRRHLGE